VIPSPGTEKRKPSLPNLQADLVWHCALSRRSGTPQAGLHPDTMRDPAARETGAICQLRPVRAC